MEHKPSVSQIFEHTLKYLSATIVCFFFVACTALSQGLHTDDRKATKHFEKAQESYQRHNLSTAKQELEAAIERDPDFIEALTLRAYIALDEADYKTAKSMFTTAVNTNTEAIPNNLFFLAELELKDGDYKNAQIHLERFLQLNPRSQAQIDKAKNELDNIAFALEAKRNPIDFNPVNMGREINSEFAEYFPCITVDERTILYTRRLPFPEAPMGFNEDFYLATKEDGKWNLSQNLKQPINTKNNEGAPSLSADGQLLIFTACELYGDYGGDRKGFGSCDLFYAAKKGKNWTNPVNLGQTINSNHWETQPSFSADGKTLYFIRGVRDRTGNRSGDIYVSKLGDDNYWTEPKKLNQNINTQKNEESVFIHPDGKTLYFSSNGHIGMGGLDIFVSRLNENGEWGKAENLGYPINTHKNENSLLISANGQTAYFASDREQGFGDLDLYTFELPDAFKPEPVTYFSGKIFDVETNKPLSARFELIDLESGDLVIESFSDQVDGSFLVTLPIGKDYALNASKDGYLFYSENFALKQNNNEQAFTKNVPLHPIKIGEKIILKNIFFETAKYKLKQNSKVELNKLLDFLKQNPSVKVEVSGHTDNVGNDSDNLILSQNRAKSVTQYLTDNDIEASRIVSKGYGDTKPISTNETDEGRAQNRRTEFKIIGL